MLALSDIIAPTEATADRLLALDGTIRNLPQLAGVSRKQIGYAHGIRKSRVCEILNLIELSIEWNVRRGCERAQAADWIIERCYENIIAALAQTSAPWWIDHRDVSINVVLYLAASMHDDTAAIENDVPPASDQSRRSVLYGYHVSVSDDALSGAEYRPGL